MKEPQNFMIYADGGARGNPGPAAYGFVIFNSKGLKIYEEGRAIGKTTNNVAEYSAVVAALKYVSERSVVSGQLSVVQIFLDSQLAAMQLSGRWKIKNENLRNLFFTIQELEQKIGAKVTYSNIPREQNRQADRLVNAALDNKF
ncbi:MAG: ribonuclease HI family protein [Candidatus Levybacteria bacterium]|nr:ribonuclease HI family protein [Candidatus Levybacteria bacterium]